MMSDLEIIFTIIIGCVLLLIPVVDLMVQTVLWNRGICEKTNKDWILTRFHDELSYQDHDKLKK